MPRYQPLNPKILLTPSHKSRRSVDLQAKTGRSRSRRSVERKQTKLLSLCSVNIHRFNNRLCLVSLSLFLSHNARLCFRHTRTLSSSPSPNRSVKSEKRGTIDDLESKCGVSVERNYLHIYSRTARGNDETGDIEERFALVAKIHREKVSIDSRVYTWRERFSRERWAVALVCSEFYRRFQFFASIDFCLKLFFFFNLYWVSISSMNDVWYCCERNLFPFFFFFFLRDEELRKEIILSSSRTFSFILRFLLWEFNSINFFNEILIFDHISCICCFVEC